MSLYAAISLIEQYIQAEANGAEAACNAIENAQVFIKDFQGCKGICPVWYKRFRPILPEPSKSSSQDDSKPT
jgi:hypothetical protein